MAYWSDYVDCDWWIDESYHPSMKLITLDMTLARVLLVRNVFFRVKNGVYDIGLLPHVNVDEFKKMSMFDVRIFVVDKETYISTI